MLHQKKYVYFEHNTILTTNTYMQIFYGYGHDDRNYIGIIIELKTLRVHGISFFLSIFS